MLVHFLGTLFFLLLASFFPSMGLGTGWQVVSSRFDFLLASLLLRCFSAKSALGARSSILYHVTNRVTANVENEEDGVRD